MILFLTYHKVLRGLDSKAEFYNTTAEVLERHLDLLSKSGFQPLSPEDLLAYKPQPQPSYLLSFDDGTRDHLDIVLPLLTRHQRRAVFFVPTAKLDREGYLSSAAVTELSRQGQVIGLHSHEHRRLDWLGEEDVRVQMELSQQILEKLTGARPMIFAPPGGFMNHRVRNMALEAGVRVIRTMRWGYNEKLNLSALDCVPVNRYMTDAGFAQVMQFRSQALAYTIKQITKRLIPEPFYRSLREEFFGWVRGK